MKTKRTAIEFDYKGKHYELYFTADSLKSMEEGGFDFTSIDQRIMTSPEKVFQGAFIAKHADVPLDERSEIFHELSDEKSGTTGSLLYDTLLLMIGEAYEELNSHSGNVKWSVRN